MKHFTLLSLFVASVFSAFSQTQIDLPITWDVPTVNYTVEPIAGAIPAVVADPTNASNSVMSMEKPTSALVYAGLIFGETSTGFELDNPIPFTSTATTISAKVYSPAAGVTYRLKVEGATGSGIQCETDKLSTVANQWETLVFDLTNNAIPGDVLNPANTYVKLILFPDFGQSGAPSATYLIDSVYFGGGTPPPPALAPIDLPITWDDTANIDYTTIAFEGGQSAAALDPTDPTNNVLKFTKPNGAQLWAGVTLGNQILENVIPFTATDNIISVEVYSPAVGMPIMMKTEVQGNGASGVEATQTTTVANQWETLSFDFSAASAGSLNYTLDYNMLSFFGDFFVAASGQEFYIDDVYFGLAPDTHMVTFQVDMANYGGTFTTPEVNGDFNNFCGNCAQMSDANSDNVWDVTIAVVGDSMEWKYSVDNLADQEALTAGSSCTKTTGAFTNRFMLLSGDTTLSVVCWSECDTCAPLPPSLDQIDLPITWDDTANVDYTTIAFEGGTSEAALDPTDATNNVLKFIKPTGAQDWAGVTLGDQELASTIPFTATANTISVKVFSPAAGMPIMLKAEVQGSTAGGTEATVNSTVANAWETLVFDFSNPTAGAIDYSLNYNMLSFFGDFLSSASDQEFYIDSVYFGGQPIDTTDTTNSINDFNLSQALTIYPNPANDQLNIKANSNDVYNITMTDILGKTIMTATLRGSELTSINTANLSEGLYLLTVSNEASSYTSKIVISH